MDAARLSAAKSSPMMETINMVRRKHCKLLLILSYSVISLTFWVVDPVSWCHMKECEVS